MPIFRSLTRIYTALSSLSLPQKLTAYALLMVTGTSWLILSLCSRESDREASARFVTACEMLAGQAVATLGPRLLHDPDATPKTSHQPRLDIYGAIQRLVQQQPGNATVTTVVNQDGRLVVVHDVRRTAEGRSYGTPIELPNAGHRANRTGQPQSTVQQRQGRTIVTAFTPVLDSSHRVLGLLILASEQDAKRTLGSTLWTGGTLALLLGLLAAGLLVVRIGRPIQRMQEQLVAKERVAPADLRSAADLLREMTKSIDRAITDRSYFEARIKQQSQGQETRIRMKDEMVANTVHELRTPLTSIIASLEIVLSHRDEMSEVELCEFVSQANIAGKHMMFLVNDLLDTAAIEAGKISMETERCNLRKLLSDAKRSMDMVAAAKSMELRVPEINKEIHVLADAARVMQVIFNLVSNSVKYSPDGGIVTIRAWANMKSVTIEIEDQGDGIPLTMRAKLFTRFSRLHQQSDTGGMHSSGIGLYLSKKLVELMQGTIGYREGEAGAGSVFWFTLPMAPIDQPSALGVGPVLADGLTAR